MFRKVEHIFISVLKLREIFLAQSFSTNKSVIFSQSVKICIQFNEGKNIRLYISKSQSRKVNIENSKFETERGSKVRKKLGGREIG